MNRKRNCKRWLAVFAMLSALMLGSIIASAASGDTVTVKVTGTYGQTEARSMLKMINDFRTGDDAWYWNEDDKTQTVFSGSNKLSELEYDYDLEKAAMQRAMEIAIQYKHVRPKADVNSKSNDDKVYPLIKPYSAAGENIAAGYSDASAVFKAWQEINDKYDGQGHRRNMLNPDFTAVGFGHVFYNNCNYWVQVFRAPTGSTVETVAIDEEQTVDVEILESNITKKEVTASEASLEIPYGDSVELPGINCEILLNGTWSTHGALCPVTLDSSSAVWTVASGSSCVSIDSAAGKIAGTKCGEAQISTTVWGKEVSVNISVTPKPIDNAEITLDSAADLSYTGSEITPEVSEVLLADTLLEEDVDYSVSYSENTEVGTATVTITGIGNYDGTATATFEIIPAELTEDNSAISAIEEQPYTGSEIEPAVTVTRSGVQLSDGDYEVSYENNIDAGEASVTVSGIGNYTGSVSAFFQIAPADLSECTYDDIPDQDFTGKQITPEVSLQWNDYPLKQEKDYTVSYGENTNVGGPASVDISGIGNFTGALQIPFEIVPADLSNAAIAEIEPQVYTGEEIIVDPAVILNETVLVQGTDYTLSYSDNVNAGQCTVTVEGTGNYTGTLNTEFTIEPMPLTDEEFTIEPIADQTYTGKAIEPAVTVYVNSTGEELELGTDYTVSYEDNSDAGTATVSISGENNYSGTLSSSFEITPVEFDETFELSIPEQTFTGEEIEAPVTVVWGKTTLKETTDYQIFSYDNNTNAGTASVTIEGAGNFSGELTGEFQILQAKLSDCTVEEIPGQTYCGEALTPEVTVSLGDYTLTAETDYVAKYSGNTEVGTATVTLSASENGTGNFTGTKTVTFDILPIDLVESEAIVRPIEDQTYTGSPIEPEVVVELDGQALKADVDYTVSCKNNQDAGKASVTVKGTGNYTGTLSADFTILPAALSDEFLVTIPNQPYTGAPVEPSISIQWGDIELVEDEDFSVTYTGDHTDAGTVKLTISGMGNYSGAIKESFQILSVDLDYCSVSPIHDQTYTGAEIFPEFTVSLGDYELIEGKDYTATYNNNIELTTARSKAEIMLSGQGNFKGSRSLTFNIVPIDLSKDGAAIQAIEDQTYTGEAITPEVTVVLKGTPLAKGTDYEVSYSDNTDVGTAAVTVTGVGNYTGELTAAFQILPKQLAEGDCTFGEIPEQTYTGAAIKPAVTVMLGEKALTADVDYTVAYSNNTKVGEATAVVTAAGNYSGELGSVSFAIVPADLADCTVEPIADQSYTGSAITPAVTVRLGENALVQEEDYTVSYENNVEIGTATVTLTGTGSCTGTQSLSFAIVAPTVSAPEPSSPAPSVPGAALPPKGTVGKDSATDCKYRVTASSASEVTVEYMAPANKKKSTVKIPDVIVIDHVPCKVTSIAANAFKNNKKLKKVVIGRNITTIGKNAFRGCTKLTTVKFNAKVSKINAAAFSNCTALKSVTIPASVKAIGKQAFYKCSRLKSITIKTKKLTTKNVGKMAFSKISRKAVVKVPSNKKKSYRTLLKKKGLPSSVKIK